MPRLVRLRRAPGLIIPCPVRRHRRDPALRQRTAAPWQDSSTRVVARRGKDGSRTHSPTTAPPLASGRTTTWYGERWATCCGRCGAGRRRRMPLKGRPLCSSEPASFAPRATWCPPWDESIRMRRTGCSDSCGRPPSVSPGRAFGPPAAAGPRAFPESATTPGRHLSPALRSTRQFSQSARLGPASAARSSPDVPRGVSSIRRHVMPHRPHSPRARSRMPRRPTRPRRPRSRRDSDSHRTTGRSRAEPPARRCTRPVRQSRPPKARGPR